MRFTIRSERPEGWYGLGPISAIPEKQGQGIGSELMNRVIDALKEIGAAGCILVGEPGFYNRFAFTAAPGMSFPGVPAEYLMALTFTGDVPVGEVTYHESFYGLG